MLKSDRSAVDASVAEGPVDRNTLIQLLNEDLAREYQAIIAYVVYSQVLKGAAYMSIAKELEVHASEELAHALIISKQIDYLGGTPTVVPKPSSFRTSHKICCASIWRMKGKRFDTIESECGNAKRWASSPCRSTFARS